MIPVDWHFFLLLLKQGANAIFTNQTVTYYRQHENNTIGIGSNNRNSINLTLNVKETHYSKMAVAYSEYKLLYKKVIELKNEIKRNDNFVDQIKTVNENHPDLFWWELKG